MTTIAVTRETHTFYEWAGRFLDGTTATIPMLDEDDRFTDLLSFVDARIVDSPEAADDYLTTDQRKHNGKYLFVRADSPYFAIRNFVGAILQSEVMPIDTLSDISLLIRDKDVRYCLVLVEPNEIHDDFFPNVYRTVMHQCPISLITGRSLSHLSWLLVKTAARKPLTTSLAVLPRSNREYTNNRVDSKLRIITNADNLHERLFSATAEQYQSFLVSSHGSEDVVSLGDVILCGKSNFYQEGRGLICQLDERCPVKTRGISASAIKAHIVVLNICFGTRVGNHFLPDDVLLHNAFLENYAAVYASPNVIKYGPDAEACFVQAVLSSGLSVGETIRLLSLWQQQTDFDIPSFVLIGDPEVCATSVRDFESRPWTDPQREFAVSPGQRLLVLNLPSDVEPAEVVVGLEGNREAYYAIIADPIEKQCQLFIFSWAGFEHAISVTLLNKESIESEISFEGIESWVFGLQRYALGKKIHRELPSVLNALDRLAVKSHELAYDGTAYRRILKDLEKFWQLVSTIQTEIMESALERLSSETSIWLPDVYYEYSRLWPVPGPFNCPFCESLSSQWEVQHRATRKQRVVLHCPKCGVVEDSP